MKFNNVSRETSNCLAEDKENNVSRETIRTTLRILRVALLLSILPKNKPPMCRGKHMGGLHRGLGCFGYPNNIFNKPLIIMDLNLRFDTRGTQGGHGVVQGIDTKTDIL